MESSPTLWSKRYVSMIISTAMFLFVSDFSVGQPLQVGAEKQVFIDGRFIEKSRGVELVVNRPRITGEKIIVPEHPWEDFYIGAYVLRPTFSDSRIPRLFGSCV